MKIVHLSAVLAVLLSALRLTAEPPAAVSSPPGYYELRIYTVTSNKLEGVLERFRETVEPVRRAHEIQTVGYWTAPGLTNGGTFVYLLAAASKEELQKQESAFGADEKFKAGYAASNQKHGKTVDGILVLPLTSDATAKLDFTAAARPRAFELRIYSVLPDKLDAFRTRWRDHAVRIYERHGLRSLGWWVAGKKDPDGNDTFICLLAADSASATEQAIHAFHADLEWRRIQKETEVNGSLRVGVMAYSMVPADFSRLK